MFSVGTLEVVFGHWISEYWATVFKTRALVALLRHCLRWWGIGFDIQVLNALLPWCGDAAEEWVGASLVMAMKNGVRVRVSTSSWASVDVSMGRSQIRGCELFILTVSPGRDRCIDVFSLRLVMRATMVEASCATN